MPVARLYTSDTAYVDIPTPNFWPITVAELNGAARGQRPDLVAHEGKMYQQTGSPNVYVVQGGVLVPVAGKAATVIGPGVPAPVASPALAVSYQASLTVATFVNVMVDITQTVTAASTLTDTVEMRIGAFNDVNTGGGVRMAHCSMTTTGIAVMVGFSQTNRYQLSGMVPAGGWFAIRSLAGTRASIAEIKFQTMT